MRAKKNYYMSGFALFLSNNSACGIIISPGTNLRVHSLMTLMKFIKGGTATILENDCVKQSVEKLFF